VDLPQENKPDSSLSAVPGFVTHRRPYLPVRRLLTTPHETHPPFRLAHCIRHSDCISAWVTTD
jgi:hypothetical protein